MAIQKKRHASAEKPKLTSKRRNPESFRIARDLDRALQAYVDSSNPKPTKIAVMEAALATFLTKVGYWDTNAEDRPPT